MTHLTDRSSPGTYRVHEPFAALAREETAAALLESQAEDGFIAWFAGGHGDPWNHVEAAMALDAVGHHVEAARAYAWVAGAQRTDGTLLASYDAQGRPREPHVDTNATSYVATGVLHHVWCTGDAEFARAMFPVVDAAIDRVVSLQRADGAVPWEVDRAGFPGSFALLAASASIYASVRAALALAQLVGASRHNWSDAARRLRDAVAHHPERFAPKEEFAMDWYYPVLTGVLSRSAGRDRLVGGMARFVSRHGVRCRSDGEWVTTAESAEAALSFARVGMTRTASGLLASVADKRTRSGAYLTGLVHPGRDEFPPGELTSYSSAAVLLADAALSGHPPTASLLGIGPESQRTRTRRLAQRASRSS